MGKLILIAVTLTLGLWLMYNAFQIKKTGKVKNGNLGQRIRYEDVEDKAYFLKITTYYHLLIGAGFVAIGASAWFIKNPTIVLFLYLFYAVGINIARAKVEALLIEA